MFKQTCRKLADPSKKYKKASVCLCVCLCNLKQTSRQKGFIIGDNNKRVNSRKIYNYKCINAQDASKCMKRLTKSKKKLTFPQSQ